MEKQQICLKKPSTYVTKIAVLKLQIEIKFRGNFQV